MYSPVAGSSLLVRLEPRTFLRPRGYSLADIRGKTEAHSLSRISLTSNFSDNHCKPHGGLGSVSSCCRFFALNYVSAAARAAVATDGKRQ
jgi:hypothetical protein